MSILQSPMKKRCAIVRIARSSGGWCFHRMVYSIEVFFPVGISGWERVALAVWQGRTLKEAITNFRRNRIYENLWR